MIQSGSSVNVIDNSGAKSAVCIKILNMGYRQRYAQVGNMLLVSVKSTKFSKNSKVKKGELYKALLVKTKSLSFSFMFNYAKFFENSVVLLTKQNKLLGTRIFGVVPSKLKYTKFLKLVSLSSGFLV